MQVTDVNTAGDTLIFWVLEGGASQAVERFLDGQYMCHRGPCIFKNTNNRCEHVNCAKQHYDDVLNVTLERKQQMERNRLMDEIERNKAKLKLLQEQLGEKEKPEEPAVLDSGYKRRIVV